MIATETIWHSPDGRTDVTFADGRVVATRYGVRVDRPTAGHDTGYAVLRRDGMEPIYRYRSWHCTVGDYDDWRIRDDVAAACGTLGLPMPGGWYDESDSRHRGE